VAITLSKDGQAEIYLLDAETGHPIRNVTRHKAIDTSPTWSPDGKRLAFVTDRWSGYPLLGLANLDADTVEMLPQIGGYNSSPDWSPTGDEIAYSAMVGAEKYQIFAINVATRTVRKLTHTGSNEEPSYSPDGRYIVYVSERNKRKGLWMMTADGKNQRPISREDADYFTPAWER
jgi:TolB protein